MSTLSKTFLTEEQYLEIERKAELKSEYFEGEMFAMSGASLAHVLLVSNIIFGLRLQLRSSPCKVLSNDLRVRVGKTGLYTYPDVVGFCGKPILLDSHQDTLLNPTLLVEVLSPSTEKYDRGRKFEHYQAIDSLKEYLLVSSERVRAELYTRQPDDRWLLTVANTLEASLDLQSIGCRLSLTDLYENVELQPDSSPESPQAERA
jgi:Uma2 family endonuclease